MSSTQFPGGPRPLAQGPGDTRKRSADAAGLAPNADRDRWDRPHPHPALIGRRDDEGSMSFMPTPISAAASGELTPTTLVLMPPLRPGPATASVPVASVNRAAQAVARGRKREARVVQEAQTFVTPAERFTYVLRNWLTYGSRSIDTGAAERMIIAVADAAHLAQDDRRLTDAHRIVDFARMTFGATVPAGLRSTWANAIGIAIHNVEATSQATWDRRMYITGRIIALRDATTGLHEHEAVAKICLVVAERDPSGSRLAGMETFLAQHEIFEMPRGDFAAMALRGRSDYWLQSVDWLHLTELSASVGQASQNAEQAAQILHAVVQLTRLNLEQVSSVMQKLCATADPPMHDALQVAYFQSIQKLGYEGVKISRTLMLDCFTAHERLTLVTALRRFDHPVHAQVAAGLLRAALMQNRHIAYRQCVVEWFTNLAGPFLESRHIDTAHLVDQSLAPHWAAAMEHLDADGYTGEQLADLAAAEVLLGGTVVDGQMTFNAGQDAWRAPVAQVPLLMQAARGWAAQGRFDADEVALLVRGAGDTILQGGPNLVEALRFMGFSPSAKLALAAALSNLDPMQVRSLLAATSLLARRLNVVVRPENAAALIDITLTQTGDIALALIQAVAARIGPHDSQQRELLINAFLPLTAQLPPAVLALGRFAADRLDNTLRLLSDYCLAFTTHPEDVMPRLQALVAATHAWSPIQTSGAALRMLLQAELRLHDALPRFIARATGAGLTQSNILFMLKPIERLPANGVSARMMLAGMQTDTALAAFATVATTQDARNILNQVLIETQVRLGDAQNVHDAARIRAADGALDMLRNLDGGMATLNAPERVQHIASFIETLADQGAQRSLWFRRRTVASRTTLENASYVLQGTYTPRRDLSRSVVETPALTNVCALVWRAIDVYQHPSGSTERTASEQRQMREDVILGLAECIQDENGFRFCPVGFKQRVIGILQGDERYPEILVDAVNAAQLLTVLSQHFAEMLQDRDPTPAQLGTFLQNALQDARKRFADEPKEIAKFEEQVRGWLEMDYDYAPQDVP